MGSKTSLMLQDEEIEQMSKATGFTPIQIEKLYLRFAHLDRNNCGSLSRNDLLSIPELAINPLCDRLIQMFFEGCDPNDERINFKQFMKVLATFRSTNNGTSASNSRSNLTLSNENNTQTKQQHISTITGSNNEYHIGKKQLIDNNIGNGKSKRGKETPTGSGSEEVLDGLHKKLLFIFKVYDTDNDGKISFNDLRSIVKMMVGNYIEDVQLDKIATRAFVEVDENNDGFIEFGEFCKVFSGKDLDDKLRVKFFT